jgi:hypothetical protein
LRDDSPHARRTGGGEKVIGALRSQPVRQGKLAVEPAEVQVRGNRRQLVHNRIGSRPRDGPDSRLFVQSIQNLWLHPLSFKMARLLGRPRCSNDNVPGFAQQRDEMPSHDSSGAGKEYSHVKLTNLDAVKTGRITSRIVDHGLRNSPKILAAFEGLRRTGRRQARTTDSIRRRTRRRGPILATQSRQVRRPLATPR